MTARKNTAAIRKETATWKAGVLSVGLIVVLTLVAYGHLWRSGYTPYSKHSDLVAQHLGMKWAAYQSVLTGRGLPFWKSDQFAGGPALTNPQALYANPFHLLFVLMNPAAAAGPTLWIHFLVIGLSMYCWGWSMGLGPQGRLFMAVASLFNFKLIVAAYAGWMAAIPAVTMSPLLLAAVTYGVRRPGIASTATLGTVGALFLVAGHPQFLYYTVLLGGSYVLMYALAEGRRRQWRTLGRQILCLTVGTALAVGITAPLLISLVADRGLITRSSADYTFFLGEHHLQPKHLLTFLYPEWLGTPINGSYAGDELWEDAAYFGLVPLVLAFVGFVMGWSRPPTRWLGGAAAACLLLTVDTPVNRFLFDWLPGYALFRLPNRLLFFVSFLGIALAAVGFEELLARWRSRQRPGWLMPAVCIGVMLAMTVEGAFYARRYVTMRPQREVIPRTDYAAFFADDSDLFRIAPAGRSTIHYGWAGPMKLQLVTGYDSYNLRHYQTYFDLLKGVRQPAAGARVWTDFMALARPDMLDALNVKYIVALQRLALPEDRYELAAQFHDQPMFVFYHGLDREDIFIYRNRSCLPRVFWANRVVNAANDRRMTEQVRQNNLHDATVVLDLSGARRRQQHRRSATRRTARRCSSPTPAV